MKVQQTIMIVEEFHRYSIQKFKQKSGNKNLDLHSVSLG